jgi:energy-coupling factor transporter ATP-binding protein EcfA2
MHDTPALQASGLTKRFGGRTVIDNVSLTIPRGGAFGLAGPEGAGKTSLIRLLLGLTPASSGSSRVLGRAAGSPRSRRDHRWPTAAQPSNLTPSPPGHPGIWPRSPAAVNQSGRGSAGPAPFESASAVVTRVVPTRYPPAKHERLERRRCA